MFKTIDGEHKSNIIQWLGIGVKTLLAQVKSNVKTGIGTEIREQIKVLWTDCWQSFMP